MRFSLLGGDQRFLRLCRQLRADGHEVRCFALPGCVGTPAEALAGADCILLPLPCEKKGFLNAPLTDKTHTVSELLRSAAPGTPVLAGMPGPEVSALCESLGLPLTDYNRREDFLLANAVLTAEGVLPLLLDSPKALGESRILLSGFGRIGKALAERLLALGCAVTVAARSPEAWRAAKALGCAAVTPGEAPGPGYDAVVNTVPAPLFSTAALEAFGPESRLIELASPPYGFDFAAAEKLGRNVVLASGLPGKTAPESAAAALRRSIYAILEERTPL